MYRVSVNLKQLWQGPGRVRLFSSLLFLFSVVSRCDAHASRRARNKDER